MRPALVALALVVTLLTACQPAPPSVAGMAPTKTENLEWTQVTQAAAFPPAYNFPVHVTDQGQFVAMHPEGTFASRDGVSWTRTPLPTSGLNSAYLKYVHHAGATYALGSFDGNYEAFTIDPSIRRTHTYDEWEELGASDTLPQVVFYAATSFKGALWMLGGYTKDQRETSEVWKSLDGLTWTLLAEQAPWSPRAGASVVVFRDRLFLIGGGEIDGPQTNDVWSSADGVRWQRETDRVTVDNTAGTPIVFDNRLWLVGANRAGTFASAVLVSNDGRTWTPQTAPWSPRGGVAVWVLGDALFMTGGKYSTERGSEIVFEYRHDVWRARMSR